MGERPSMEELRERRREESGREPPECSDCGRGPRKVDLHLYGIACPGARRIYICSGCAEGEDDDT